MRTLTTAESLYVSGALVNVNEDYLLYLGAGQAFAYMFSVGTQIDPFYPMLLTGAYYLLLPLFFNNN